MKKKLLDYDAAEYLDSKESIAVFLEEAFKTQDTAFVAHAIGVVARAKGMTQIARETGLSREQLYRSFSMDGNPSLQSTFAVLRALGVHWTFARDAA